MFLLPGESLAKYHSRSSSEPDAEDVEPVGLQPDDPDAPTVQDISTESLEAEAFEEERFEVGQIDLVESASGEPAAESEPEPLPAAPEIVAAAFPDSAFFTTPVLPEPELQDESVESASAAGIDIEAIEEEEEENDEAPLEEPPSDSEKAPVEEPNPDQPLQASVREQGNRYQHRSSRRMRRRGRGGERPNDRGADRNQGDRGTNPGPRA